MSLEEGKLYNVHGIHIYGAGSTSTRAIESWEQIMYVQDEHVYQDGENKSHIFLADGDQHGGSIDEGILTRVKVPFRRFTLIGDEVITNRILGKTTICMPPGEHFESTERFLRKAEGFAERLFPGEKRDRYLAMIRNSIYEEYEEGWEGNVYVVKKKDPVIARLMQKLFPDSKPQPYQNPLQLKNS